MEQSIIYRVIDVNPVSNPTFSLTFFTNIPNLPENIVQHIEMTICRDTRISLDIHNEEVADFVVNKLQGYVNEKYKDKECKPKYKAIKVQRTLSYDMLPNQEL